MAEMLTYEQHLTSATGGRGAYSMDYSHYDEVPSHLQAKIVAARRPSAAEEAGGSVGSQLRTPQLRNAQLTPNAEDSERQTAGATQVTRPSVCPAPLDLLLGS